MPPARPADGAAFSARPRRGIATVCLSGTLEDKLTAAAAAGFDGIEVFEPDLIASPWSPAELATRCADLGLSIDLYQPFRDLDSTDPARFAANLRRAERKFDVMGALGVDTVLVCSSVAPDAVADVDQLAEQLSTTAARAELRGLRIAYEALAWGRHVSTWDASWDAVRRADVAALGLCLDSFHVLSRGGDPSGFAAVPGEKVFFLQLADAPQLTMDVLQWSRHHRLFPGQGAFDLPGFLGAVLATGYRGPLSLEVFNDVYRQSDPARTAVDAMRSLQWLEEALALVDPAAGLRSPPAAPELSGWSFTELAVDGVSGPQVGQALTALGFTHTGQHRSKPVQLWEQGAARVLLNASVVRPGAPGEAAVSALGLESSDPGRSAGRAEAMSAPVLPRTRGAAEAELSAVAAPDGTEVFFTRTGPDGWPADFLPTGAPPAPGAGLTGIDHVALTQPFDAFDEAGLFYRAVLGLEPQQVTELAAPFGLVRTRAVTGPDRAVRLTLSASSLRRGGWAPRVLEPQYLAFATDDVVATAERLRAAGAPLLRLPANYADDLEARFDLPADLLAAVREHGLLYEEDAHGACLHLATEVLGDRLFVMVVQRLGGYDGYGNADAPVRMTAHRRQRRAPAVPAGTPVGSARIERTDVP
ncbi:bifunctional sugar phosphate isomerase/epimerase/4-hydroxyphenylpyruvate dioxygenase family protein [Modestobacter sp. VKM Ac-2978]|uniref:bifunctional sugar phosphate isomerase/epimerase/4-hydroxyphenylpyruvate dioxygenase family protein n=1 Tax=Modestobacter sp. VKM Ac-2978 TaxID=3004132 RepID=UPI0022AB38F0|nr:sugar phosphate isomerase/epimerase and 4-hydroxyphenylpyruvate domain-containing protein [Modestobacter sp. VKM Ac-2978]MCZ2850479.1 TIM barrel protein [Modestobacter sp. VKM Ac-2978]